MKILSRTTKKKVEASWDEQSGLLDFLDRVPREIDRFNRSFGFGLRQVLSPVAAIDGNRERVKKLVFLVIRENPLVSDMTHCLYTTLHDRSLSAGIGLYRGDCITTLRQLDSPEDFPKGESALHEWMKQLLRASFEKITL